MLYTQILIKGVINVLPFLLKCCALISLQRQNDLKKTRPWQLGSPILENFTLFGFLTVFVLRKPRVIKACNWRRSLQQWLKYSALTLGNVKYFKAEQMLWKALRHVKFGKILIENDSKWTQRASLWNPLGSYQNIAISQYQNYQAQLLSENRQKFYSSKQFWAHLITKKTLMTPLNMHFFNRLRAKYTWQWQKWILEGDIPKNSVLPSISEMTRAECLKKSKTISCSFLVYFNDLRMKIVLKKMQVTDWA